MNQATIDTLAAEDFEAIITDYISWASEWDGALPADTFFGTWADLQTSQQPVALKAKVIGGQLQFIAPPDSPIRVIDNRISIRDGLELVVELESTV